MPACPSCAAPVAGGARFCAICGAVLASDSVSETAYHPAPTRPASRPSERGGFAPGALVGERYRIVAFLGRGGMGEVYHAEDLKLGQEVALKFLPRELARDAERIERLYAEVRLARQVSHPNVCRVYDVGEVGGHPFLTMEYIDGEDLASLLRRIGRLPPDKATEIAQQLAAGLAAAHERGFLHRDLKPANVMLDGRGRARITDFGLAVEAAGLQEGGVAGTPAYMAPEVLAGQPPTAQSDLYSLGLLLYEVYLGKPAISGAGTLAEWRRKHGTELPPSPSSVVADLPPGVEETLMRCLEKEPARRPRSALAVAAGLPGGDPPAAALAAGETPSPDLVAAAGEAGILPVGAAWAALAIVLLGLPLFAFFAPWISLHGYLPLDEPPEALADTAWDIARLAAPQARFRDTAYSLEPDRGFLRWQRERRAGEAWWEDLGGTPAMVFWQRHSPQSLVSRTVATHLFPGRVSWSDPPPAAGEVRVRLDSTGRLQGLRRLPDPGPSAAVVASPEAAVDWRPFFAAAGLDLDRFVPTAPRWVPEDFADQRFAWLPRGRGEGPDRVEAAALAGAPVSFRLVWPWTEDEPAGAGSASVPIVIVVGILFLLIFLTAVLVARRNLRLGRGDRRGAGRLAAGFLAVGLFSWTIMANHTLAISELGGLMRALAWSLFLAVVVATLYLAFEPFIRRRLPGVLVSWSRIMAGRLRDPLVGRDVLVGIAGGVAFGLLGVVVFQLERLLTLPPPPAESFLVSLATARIPFGDVVVAPFFATFFLLFLVFLLVALRLLVRQTWLAAALLAALFGVLQTAAGAATGQVAGITFAFSVVYIGLGLGLLLRFGLVATIAFVVTMHFLSYPITLDFSVWYVGRFLPPLLAILLGALLAFRWALAGRPAFGRLELAEEI